MKNKTDITITRKQISQILAAIYNAIDYEVGFQESQVLPFWKKYDETESRRGFPFPNNVVETVLAFFLSTASWMIYFVIALSAKGAWP